ncbi:MAG: methionine biosynthesis protein MetW [Spirochaetales bacterium]|nr:methionine biosynthesis protein MetW [Spirochaetales bacterium]
MFKRSAEHFSYEEIARLVEPGSSVLDLGCGNGELLQLLRDTRDAAVRGVEIEESMIRECLAKGISVFQGNLDEGLKEYGSGSYDYVILNETLQVVHEPVQIIREMVRVGRTAIVNFPNFGTLLNRLQLSIGGRMPVTKDLPLQWYNTPNIHFCTRRDFVQLCREMEIPIIAAVDIRHGRRISPGVANLLATECCFLLRGSSAEATRDAGGV